MSRDGAVSTLAATLVEGTMLGQIDCGYLLPVGPNFSPGT